MISSWILALVSPGSKPRVTNMVQMKKSMGQQTEPKLVHQWRAGTGLVGAGRKWEMGRGHKTGIRCMYETTKEQTNYPVNNKSERNHCGV